ADPEIDVIQGAGFDPDQNLVLTRPGIGHVLIAQNFRTTEFMDANGLHGSSEMKSNYHRRISKSPPISMLDIYSARRDHTDGRPCPKYRWSSASSPGVIPRGFSLFDYSGNEPTGFAGT